MLMRRGESSSPSVCRELLKSTTIIRIIVLVLYTELVRPTVLSECNVSLEVLSTYAGFTTRSLFSPNLLPSVSSKRSQFHCYARSIYDRNVFHYEFTTKYLLRKCQMRIPIEQNVFFIVKQGWYRGFFSRYFRSWRSSRPTGVVLLCIRCVVLIFFVFNLGFSAVIFANCPPVYTFYTISKHFYIPPPECKKPKALPRVSRLTVIRTSIIVVCLLLFYQAYFFIIFFSYTFDTIWNIYSLRIFSWNFLRD